MLQVHAFTFSPVQEKTYLLIAPDGRCALVDPGCYFPEERQVLQDFVARKDLRPVLLLNTHCHLDHVFGNRFVHETWGLSLHLHRDEKPVLDFAPVSGRQWQLPFDSYEGPLVYLEAGEKIAIGEEELEIRLAPGHSPGHLVFYYPTGGFLIGGDVLFRGSVGRTDLPRGDFTILERSIKTQLYTLPDDTVVYPGHGEPTTIGYEKKANPFVRGI